MAHHVPKQARYQLRYTRLLSCFIRLGVFSQIKRDTTFTTPGYSIFAIIPRRRRKSKIFLSVVIPVVKAVFRPGFMTRRNPTNARAARLSGLRLLRSWMKSTAHPKQARYQLCNTPIFNFEKIPVRDYCDIRPLNLQAKNPAKPCKYWFFAKGLFLS